jgi:hypothetical protein
VSLVSGSGGELSDALVRNDDEPPTLDFGPLITAKSVEGLRVMYSEAIGKGAISLYESDLDESLFFPEQDISAYIALHALINVPRNCALYHRDPSVPSTRSWSWTPWRSSSPR